jgi:steroid delta-isomerase-like uncharacterized protein
MATAPLHQNEAQQNKRAVRVEVVKQHVRMENEHNLDGVLATFGTRAHYEDSPWNEHHEGRDGVRNLYAQLMQVLPDLSIDIVRQHVADETVLLEVIIRGTHLGAWRGLPATGRQIEFPLCGVYTFNEDNSLAGEKIYYDRATVLRQLGVFHEPETALGRVTMLLTHPITIARAFLRGFVRAR